MLPEIHRQYTSGNTQKDALKYARKLNNQGIGAIISSLGEKSASAEHAKNKKHVYCSILDSIDDLDATVSVKPSDMGINIDYELALENYSEILSISEEKNKTIEIDMEFRSLLEPTVDLCKQVLKEGFSVRLAMQSGLMNAMEYTMDICEAAQQSLGKASFRIVTGSCYHKSTNGYVSTLETPYEVTDTQFYDLIDFCKVLTEKNHAYSSIGTNVSERIEYAASKGLEIQFLKGEENTQAYQFGLELKEYLDARMTVYTTFGDFSDPGVQAYLSRRLVKH